MRTLVLLTLVGLLAGSALTPTANAGHECPGPIECDPPWECLQVYPWSRLCEGDVVGFLEAYGVILDDVLA